MSRPIIRLLSNFFIVSSYRNQTINDAQLVRLANQAFFARDYKSLPAIAQGLMNLSPRTEAAGRYFQALSICRDGAMARVEALRIFEELTDQPNPILRSLALIGLADETIYYQANPSELFTSLIGEATRLSYRSGAYLPFIQCQSDLSVQQSLLGNHQGALQLLQGISKLMETVKGIYPALYLNYLNNVSYELAATGEDAAAWHAIQKAVTSPYAARFPEWLDTQQMIEEKRLRRATPTTIFVPEATAQAYEYCFENVYRLNSFYEFQPLKGEKPKSTEASAGAQAEERRDEPASRKADEDSSNVHFFPSPEVLATPRRNGEGVFEVRVLYRGQRRSLYVIPELIARLYTDWFTQLDQLEPSPDSAFELQVAFCDGVEEFIFISTPLAREVIERLRWPAQQDASALSPSATEILQSAAEILQVAKRLLALVEDNLLPLSANPCETAAE